MIYFIQRPEGGPIKIGTAIAVDRRVGELSSQYKSRFSILAVMEGDRIVEASLHDRFCRLRTEGEWFNPGPELTCFISQHGKQWKGRDDPETNGTPQKMQVGVNVDLKVWQRIKDIQHETGATPSAIVNRILLAWFQDHPGFELPQLKQEAQCRSSGLSSSRRAASSSTPIHSIMKHRSTPKGTRNWISRPKKV